MNHFGIGDVFHCGVANHQSIFLTATSLQYAELITVFLAVPSSALLLRQSWTSLSTRIYENGF
jgi:hypothetical protein